MDAPQDAPQSRTTDPAPEAAAGTRPARLKRRGDFLRVAAARRKVVTAGFILQAAPNPAVRRLPAGATPPGPRLGFTCSRKVGNAVVRNRARRRLRAAADTVFPTDARPGLDYVLIGRQETNDQTFARLLEDLRKALKRVAEARPTPGGGGGGRKGRPGGRSGGRPSRAEGGA
ncbi:ribonuclease P protein component [Roseospira navarrensis]|uniref:Ribonuclease P protein component n=1 Tax=Roseospira navarrensis TaxID=140058 RepID=A0A7X1ZBD4_9PROT|nr:ribonuclease P protein component [Roseospira navarrensis]MQX35414.1 ribonuclease P protein component [Roseospira navarrensis]